MKSIYQMTCTISFSSNGTDFEINICYATMKVKQLCKLRISRFSLEKKPTKQNNKCVCKYVRVCECVRALASAFISGCICVCVAVHVCYLK